ncbi:hypothetical protein [Sphingomonas sp. MMS24-J13]|uniref:hypothetical protein n=1 Tax=Sphingomonas sp. MMS24-J13 TaxID=3238686 RepID=UPI0038517E54
MPPFDWDEQMSAFGKRPSLAGWLGMGSCGREAAGRLLPSQRNEREADNAPVPAILPLTALAQNPPLAQRCGMDRDTSPSLRSMTWSHIVERYRFRKGDRSADMFSSALDGIEQLAVTVADGPLSSKLFGWVSMFDLCIQQTDAIPYSGPYLRVSPLASGAVEFRYFDTAIPARQWHREVPPEATVPRFEAFVDQLHWIGS